MFLVNELDGRTTEVGCTSAQVHQRKLGSRLDRKGTRKGQSTQTILELLSQP